MSIGCVTVRMQVCALVVEPWVVLLQSEAILVSDILGLFYRDAGIVGLYRVDSVACERNAKLRACRNIVTKFQVDVPHEQSSGRNMVCLRYRVADVSFLSNIRHIRDTKIVCWIIGVGDRLKGIRDVGRDIQSTLCVDFLQLRLPDLIIVRIRGRLHLLVTIDSAP